jgi:hypothetical protein
VVGHAAAADALAAAERRITGRRTPVDDICLLN